jgi:hypothetical protein
MPWRLVPPLFVSVGAGVHEAVIESGVFSFIRLLPANCGPVEIGFEALHKRRETVPAVITLLPDLQRRLRDARQDQARSVGSSGTAINAVSRGISLNLRAESRLYRANGRKMVVTCETHFTLTGTFT